LFDAAVAAALPDAASIAPFLPAPPKGRTLVLGAGKAGGSMAAAVEAAWPAGARISGLVVTRYDYVPAAFAAAQRAGSTRIEVVEAAHPVPDEAGRRAAARIGALARGLSEDDPGPVPDVGRAPRRCWPARRGREPRREAGRSTGRC
jgi:hydroxypyruvate reductase